MIRLSGRSYTMARDLDGTPVVLVLRSQGRVMPGRPKIETWARAPVREAVKVLAGLGVCPLRIVT